MDQNLEASYHRSSILKDCNEEELQPSFDDSYRALWGTKTDQSPFGGYPHRKRLAGALVVQVVASVQFPSPPRQVAHWAHDQEHRESPN